MAILIVAALSALFLAIQLAAYLDQHRLDQNGPSEIKLLWKLTKNLALLNFSNLTLNNDRLSPKHNLALLAFQGLIPVLWSLPSSSQSFKLDSLNSIVKRSLPTKICRCFEMSEIKLPLIAEKAIMRRIPQRPPPIKNGIYSVGIRKKDQNPHPNTTKTLIEKKSISRNVSTRSSNVTIDMCISETAEISFQMLRKLSEKLIGNYTIKNRTISQNVSARQTGQNFENISKKLVANETIKNRSLTSSSFKRKSKVSRQSLANKRKVSMKRFKTKRLNIRVTTMALKRATKIKAKCGKKRKGMRQAEYEYDELKNKIQSDNKCVSKMHGYYDEYCEPQDHTVQSWMTKTTWACEEVGGYYYPVCYTNDSFWDLGVNLID
ncbi:hypothetical protein CHUAL_012556 [Chamberlinius hualienensis]